MKVEPLTLYQFRLSMFPEKARWALDYKRIPHIRHNLLPGPHLPKVLKMTNKKQTCMPLLQTESDLLTDSTQILDWLEEHHPECSLYPATDNDRKLMHQEIARFDDWGVHCRLGLFHAFLPHTRYAAHAFAQGVNPLMRKLYTLVFPLTRIAMKRTMNITDENAEHSNQQIKEALDYLAEKTIETGYLVGDRFTAADLTAASCLHCVAHPPQFPATFPSPRATRHQAWVDRWSAHPATHWVRDIYAKHRPPSTAIVDID